ncbi:MAG TPA: NAD(P)/FAD-dependent oxidoreductase [Terriglobales bacterium]|nr:NAD(P)/FAD-dependent oxidoreductase [Terriglobales bacterium]
MNAKRHAAVVGSGPNGLAAAIVLAQAGLDVEVFEAQPQPGGGARTAEITEPGFHHDLGSAVHPFAAASPFFQSLPLQQHGLEWINSPAALAHPLDDGTAVMLERNLDDAVSALGADGPAWRKLMGSVVEHWDELIAEVFGPVPLLPRHAFLMARFGMRAIMPATTVAKMFPTERAKALFAGIAAHSFLSLDEAMSSAFGILLGAAAHVVGWPIPRGGAQSITNALCGVLALHGGKIATSRRVENVADFDGKIVMCDVTPRQLLQIAENHLSERFKRLLRAYRYGPGVFKVDYALNAPIPWKASECARAATVHLGGNMEQVAASEATVRRNQIAEKPFVLLSQPTLFDPSRAPAGKHIAWAYCHVPNGSEFDMLHRLEAQIERFAPGFHETVIARHVFTPAGLQRVNENLIGGDISGGVLDVRQFLWRPTSRLYGTSARNIYICSSSTPPGGGVHGMCGYHAAKLALSHLR